MAAGKKLGVAGIEPWTSQLLCHPSQPAFLLFKPQPWSQEACFLVLAAGLTPIAQLGSLVKVLDSEPNPGLQSCQTRINALEL